MGYLQTLGEYQNNLKQAILTATQTSEQRLEILCNSPHWKKRLESTHPEAFAEQREMIGKAMTELDESSSQMKEGEYWQKAEKLKKDHECQDLVRKFTREYLVAPDLLGS